MSTLTTEHDLKSAFEAAFARRAQVQDSRTAPFMRTRRHEAFAHFQAQPLPTRRHEEWKFTPIQSVLPSEPTVPAANLSAADWAALSNLGQDANVLVFANGRFARELSTVVSPPHELTLLDLAEAEAQNLAVLEAHFARLAPDRDEVFTALNTALSEHGAVVQVPSGVTVGKPVVLFFLTDARRQSVCVHPRNLVVVGDHSQVQLLSVYRTIGEAPTLNNSVTEVFVGKNAQATFHLLQDDVPTASHIHTTYARQGRDSSFTQTTLSLRGKMIRNNLTLQLDDINCTGRMYGLYMLDGQTHVDNHTLVDHLQPHSFSDELYRGIVADQATGVFNGKIFVRPDAQKTNAFQSNHNLLLSDTATVHTKPQLEIYADDVKCSHGATTGQLDAEALFYLRARGIGEVNARALLIRAFAGEVLDKIEWPALHAHLEARLDERLTV